MTNGEFVDDKKIKDILTYIKSMKHSEQIRKPSETKRSQTQLNLDSLLSVLAQG